MRELLGFRFLRLTHNWLIPNTLHISLSLYCTVNWLANNKEREIAKLGLPYDFYI